MTTMMMPRVKADASPIDNITKFAWDEEDFELVEVELSDEEEARLDAQRAAMEAEKAEQEKQASIDDAIIELYELITGGAE